MTKEEIGLEVWKETLRVQQHFNELGMRVRTIAITVLAALIGAVGYLFKEKEASIAGYVTIGSILCWAAFYFMDGLWYHRLLRASVKHGEQIEADLAEGVRNIGLTTRISEGSPIWGLNAGERLFAFYLIVGYLQWVAAVKLLGFSDGTLWWSSIALVALVIACLAVRQIKGQKPA